MENNTHSESITRDFDNAEINGKRSYGEDPEEALQRMKTSGTGSVTISSDLFEKLYLQPKFEGPALKHPLQKVVGNPTALAIIGFEMSLLPITMQLMEWRGAKGSRTANNANVICYGGVLMFTSGLMEFILGNTFPFLVFCTYGAFYASYGFSLIPWFATYQSFSSDPSAQDYSGLATAGYNASYGHYWLGFTIVTFIFFICSLRTNLVFLSMFTLIVVGIGCLTGIFYNAALGNADLAHNCQKAAGAVLFATCMIGWYLLLALILPSVDFPISLPLGDLQGVVPGLSERQARRGTGSGRSGWSIFRRKKSAAAPTSGDAV